MPFIYILKCEDDCWYIGWTQDLQRRIAEHFRLVDYECHNTWTDIHRPLEVKGYFEVEAGGHSLEQEITMAYVKKYGLDKVAGGTLCSEKNRSAYLKRLDQQN
jgi:predicted GIY-YIG superfamily endonuclease